MAERIIGSGRITGVGAALAVAAGVLLSGSSTIAQTQILEIDSGLLLRRPMLGVPTSGQGVTPVVGQRGVNIDGTARAPAAFPWGFAGNPSGESWNRNGNIGEVSLSTGSFVPTYVDIALPAIVPWTVARSYNGIQEDDGGNHRDSDGFGGRNWYHNELPELYYDANVKAVYIVYGADRFLEFALVDGDEYKGKNGAAGVVKHDTGDDMWVYYDQNGMVTTFFGAGGGLSGNSNAEGQLWKVEDPDGNKAYVGHPTDPDIAGDDYTAPGAPAHCYDSSDRQFTYTYATLDSVLRVTSIVAETKTGGVWGGTGGSAPSGVTQVAEVEYSYYTGSDANGDNGNLKLATVTTPTSKSAVDQISQTYTRYYTGSYSLIGSPNPGHPNTLKAVVSAEGVRRSNADHSAGWYLTASDSAIKTYADNYLEYNGKDYRISCAYFAGCCGCSGGTGNYCYTYWTLAEARGVPGREPSMMLAGGAASSDIVTMGVFSMYSSAVASRVVTEQPDGTFFTQYFDETGQALGRVITAGDDMTSGDPAGTPLRTWATNVVRNGDGQITEIDSPENIGAGYDHSTQTFTSGATGLITFIDRVLISDTAHASLVGFPEHVRVQDGTGGTATFVSSTQYAEDGDANVFKKVLTDTTIYRPNVIKTHRYPAAGTAAYNDGGSPAVTEYVEIAMTPASAGVLYPVESQHKPKAVSAGNNGSGSQNESKRHYRDDGRVDFTRAPEGYITYTGYNTHGQVVKSIEDADTTQTGTGQDFDGISIPTGYSSSGSPLHLKTTYTYDAQGRLDTVTLPSGRVMKNYYTKLSDGRMVTLRIPRVTGGTTFFGPVSYSVSNLKGKPEFQGVIAVGSSGTTSALSGWINDGSSNPVSAVSVGTLARESVTVFDEPGVRVLETRSYYSIAGPGSDATVYGYDSMGRTWRVKDATGTITRSVYDELGRVTERHVGTNDYSFMNGEGSGPDTMTKVEEVEYDSDGDGNSHVTSRTAFVENSGTGARETTYAYDYRGRMLLQTNPAASPPMPHVLMSYDNLNRTLATGLYSSTGSITVGTTDPAGSATNDKANRVGVSRTLYDENGRTYATFRDKVIQSDGSFTSGDALATLTWYDKSGRVVKTRGEQITKTMYDRVGRAVKRFVLASDNDSSYTAVYDTTNNVTEVGNDIVMTESQTAFDYATGTVVMSAEISRFYDDLSNGTAGPLDTNADSNPLKLTAANITGRVQITAMWYDALDRPVDTVQYGTNGTGNITDFDRKPSGTWLAVPSRGPTALRTTTAYNDDGTVQIVTDPRAFDTKFIYDDLGRKVTSIANFTGASAPIGTADRDNDLSTRYEYTHGLMTAMWVDIDADGTKDTDDQVTTYAYGVVRGTDSSKISSNRLLYKAIYPPQYTTGGGQPAADRTVSFGYNAQGQQVWTKDQLGVEIATMYDLAGRETERATTIPGGSGIDTAVRKIGMTYTARGQVEKVTQYDGSSAVIDEVKHTYEDWGVVSVLGQDVNSAVAGGGSGDNWDVGFTYASAGAGGTGYPGSGGRNTLRRATQTVGYPATPTTFQTIDYEYLSSSNRLDADLSRVTDLKVAGTVRAEYQYNGIGQVVNTHLPEPAAYSSLDDSAGARTFGRMDRFDRVTNSRWTKDSTTRHYYNTSIVYDESSNIIRTTDAVYPGRDVSYSIDDINRLTQAEEGTWGGSSIGSRTRQEDWFLSQTGNFSRTKLDLTGNNNWTDANEYDDTRTHTNVNEILTRDTNSSSPVEATLVHSLRGDMTDDGLDYTYVYDAFGRLRFIKTRGGSPTVIAEYTYNGLGQRIGWHYDVNASGTVDSSDVWFHFFYDERWRMVATVRSSSGTLDTSPKELFVNHQAGLGGYGGSSYIDTVTIIDRDITNGWSGAADGTLEQRHYPLQNWRADVVATVNASGWPQESARYSAYGVRTQFLPADFNSNGAITIDDLFLYQNAYFANDPSADFNFSGGVTIDDLFLYNNAYFTGGAVGRNALSTLGIRKGFAGYENDGVLVRFSHVRNRVYDNVLARWTRRDPIGYVDGMSLYQYVGGRPVFQTDSTGLCATCMMPAQLVPIQRIPITYPLPRDVCGPVRPGSKEEMCGVLCAGGVWGAATCFGKDALVCNCVDYNLQPHQRNYRTALALSACINRCEQLHFLTLQCWDTDPRWGWPDDAVGPFIREELKRQSECLVNRCMNSCFSSFNCSESINDDEAGLCKQTKKNLADNVAHWCKSRSAR